MSKRMSVMASVISIIFSIAVIACVCILIPTRSERLAESTGLVEMEGIIDTVSGADFIIQGEEENNF